MQVLWLLTWWTAFGNILGYSHLPTLICEYPYTNIRFSHPFHFEWLLYLWLYVCLCVGMHRWLQCPPRPEKSVRPLELESLVAVSHLMWVLGMNSGPPQQQCALVIPSHLSTAITSHWEKAFSSVLELDDLGDWQQGEDTAVTMKECSWPGFWPDNDDVGNKIFVKIPNYLLFWSSQCHWLSSESSHSNPSIHSCFMVFSFSYSQSIAVQST